MARSNCGKHAESHTVYGGESKTISVKCLFKSLSPYLSCRYGGTDLGGYLKISNLVLSYDAMSNLYLGASCCWLGIAFPR